MFRETRPFDKDEVFDAIKNMNGDIALGPDGWFFCCFPSKLLGSHKRRYNAGFVFFFFPKAFHEYGLFERSLNASFVALIPNEVGLWM